MAKEGHLSANKNLEYHLITFFEKLDTLRTSKTEKNVGSVIPSLRVEIKSLDFWRSVISECLASFVYVFIVCGAAASAGVGASIASMLLATALAGGCTMTSLTQCFAHISGAHVNPAVTVAMGVTKNISVLRTIMYIIAQCGGGIAGAAFLYSVTVPGYQGNLTAAIEHSASVPPWERFGIELILTFIIVFSYFVSMDDERKWMSSPALTIGTTYSACLFVSMPYLNPARSLGPSFVLNTWDNHWVFWIGPIIGGFTSGLMYKFIFNPRRRLTSKDTADGDSSSLHSEEDAYDDLNKPATQKFQDSNYSTYKAAPNPTNSSGYRTTSASLYATPPTKFERVESLYGGTKSLYCKSPPLTRANLNRSQSVYTKSNSTLNRDTLLKNGPLVPARSLYPMRLDQQCHIQNQNLQNQLQQRSESIYGMRGITPGTARNDNYSLDRDNRVERDRPSVYGMRSNTLGNDNSKYEDNSKAAKTNRPESMYGMMSSQVRRGQSAQSDDSSYSSYQSTAPRSTTSATNAYTSNNNNQQPHFQNKTCNSFGQRAEMRPSPSSQPQSAANSSSYHQPLPQHSSNSTQY